MGLGSQAVQPEDDLPVDNRFEDNSLQGNSVEDNGADSNAGSADEVCGALRPEKPAGPLSGEAKTSEATPLRAKEGSPLGAAETNSGGKLEGKLGKLNWTHRPEVDVTVSDDGSITDVQVGVSSGHAILDKAAVRAAWSMVRIDWAPSREFILRVPFRLVD